MIQIDKTEVTLGGKRSGVVIRYRGNIRGVMILVRDHELSWFNYRGITALNWNNILRVPGMKTRTW
jgi:hypothetical protein